MLSVLLVGGSHRDLTTVSCLLKGHEQIHFCGQLAASEKVLTDITKLRPDIIWVDIDLPEQSGLTFLPAVARNHSRLLILF